MYRRRNIAQAKKTWDNENSLVSRPNTTSIVQFVHLFRSPRPRDPSNSGRRIQNILSYAGDTIVGTSNGRTERGSRACRNAWINEQGSTREQDERASAPFQRDAHAPWARGEGETNEEKTKRERESVCMCIWARIEELGKRASALASVVSVVSGSSIGTERDFLLVEGVLPCCSLEE